MNRTFSLANLVSVLSHGAEQGRKLASVSVTRERVDVFLQPLNSQPRPRYRLEALLRELTTNVGRELCYLSRAELAELFESFELSLLLKLHLFDHPHHLV